MQRNRNRKMLLQTAASNRIQDSHQRSRPMAGMLLRRGLSVLAILGSLVIASFASVSSVAASPQMGSGDGVRFAYSGTSTCPSPPAAWDPTTATADQLRFYGLPLPRASSGSIYQQ